MTLTVRNVPEAVAARLRARAQGNHRSLQGEILAILEASVSASGVPEEASGSGASKTTDRGASLVRERAEVLYPKLSKLVSDGTAGRLLDLERGPR